MKKLYIITGILTLTVGGIVGATTLTKTQADPDPVVAIQQEQHQDEVLDNHEARITNLEGDVTALQSSTATPPSTQRQTVPQVQTAKPESPVAETPVVASPTPPDPTPPPVTIVGFEEVPIENSENTNCKYTYSDGTSGVFEYKSVTYNQGTKLINYFRLCDSRVIGERKP